MYEPLVLPVFVREAVRLLLKVLVQDFVRLGDVLVVASCCFKIKYYYKF